MPSPLSAGEFAPSVRVQEAGARVRVLVWSCVVVATALAWAYLIHLDRHMAMMERMGTTMSMPWTRTDAAFAFAMWVVMMLGMMAAPAAPALTLFAGMGSSAVNGRSALALPGFAFGYLLVWTAFSAVATFVQWALHGTSAMNASMAAASPTVAGAILIAAGAYQFLPLKSACLAHCRSPLGFFVTHWRDGWTGALRMGMRHGAYCLGCCWALMAVLFAVGVMNLAWVALLTVLVLFEKTGPAGTRVARIAGAALIAGGVWRMAVPA